MDRDLCIYIRQDSGESEFELPNMPQPILTRSRLRDRNTNSDVKQNNSSVYNVVDNFNKSNNNNCNAPVTRDSARRGNRNKPDSTNAENQGNEDSTNLVSESKEFNAQNIGSGDIKDRVEAVSNEEKLESYLKECLTECSRQRIRAIHMSMRRYGNVDSRITLKDLHQAFQENNVKLSNRVFHQINDTFVDHLGIDYERLHRSMTKAQLLTRRDSVEAMLSQNNNHKSEMSRETSDADYLRRLEEQLVLDQTFFDLDEIKRQVQEKDKHNKGRIPKDEYNKASIAKIIVEEYKLLQSKLARPLTQRPVIAYKKNKSLKDILMYKCCRNSHIPLYGALLKNLVNYCDEGHQDSVSWKAFITFLEDAQKSAIENHPEMAELPEKAKLKQMASPLDLMDQDKKSRIVKTLLKKASASRVNLSSALSSLSTQSEAEKTTNEIKGGDPTVSVEIDNEPSEPNAQTDDARTERARKLFQKVRSSAGFLSSVRDLLAGKKKEAELVGPIIEIDPSSVTTTAEGMETATSGEQTLPPVTPESNTVTISVKGQDVTVMKPTGYSTDNASIDLPTERLELDWIYGYRGNDCRRNIHVLQSGEIIYFVASTVILYERTSHCQRHYQEHTDRIKCIDVHSNGVTVASGQMDSHQEANETHVRIWRSDTMETLQILGMGLLEKSVTCMAFRISNPKPVVENGLENSKSKPVDPVTDNILGDMETPPKDTIADKADQVPEISDGNTDLLPEEKSIDALNELVIVDGGTEKTLAAFNVDTGELIAKTKVDTEVICDVGFNPLYPYTFVTIGKEYITWWTLGMEQKSIETLNQPLYENHPKAKFIICLVHSAGGDLITGDSNGTIYVWADGGNKITKSIKQAHEGPVFTVLLQGDVLITGGRDGCIKSWNYSKDLEALHTIEIPKSEGGVRMLQIQGEKLLIGTTTNSILSGVLSCQVNAFLEGMELDDIPLTQGHYGECRGLAVINEAKHRGQFISVGQDGIISVVSSEKREPVRKFALKGTTFNAVDSSGQLMALGTKDGFILILTISEDQSFVEEFRQKVSKDKVTCIKISPDLNSVAVGTGDKGVIVYQKQIKEGGTALWELYGKYRGHKGCVTAIDWSSEKADGSYLLRSSSSFPDQIFWKVDSLEKVDSIDDIQHICWDSNLCTLDLSTIGVWTGSQAEEAEVNSVDVNPAKTLVAMGDSSGYVSLYKYPSCRQGALSHKTQAHRSVEGLRFVGDGKYLVTLGGADSSVMQWKVK